MIGFKSFASKTIIEFRPGITAVVGPNGCGKSNIVDSIRWVLGEQKTSTLRAERMEAVIFNGTQKRRPLGMSEVTLTIENDKGKLPLEYAEVAVTRRLFRSGESEYRINRTPSRLRDIHDLFVDTGLGHGAYSIIELSMVEGIITGPPDSRRILIEEAAGIAKYRSRRQSTEKRLVATRENLVRLEDIYQEIEKRYRTLKRQASRARSYQALGRALELRILADLAEERVEITGLLRPLESQLLDLGQNLEESEQKGEELANLISQREARDLTLLDQLNRAQDLQRHLFRREIGRAHV